LRIYVAVYWASPHNSFFISASNNNALTFSISVLLRRSALPFNCGVCGTVVLISIPLFLHHCITVLFIYSLLLSQRISLIFKFNFASILYAKSFSFSALFLLLSKYTIIKCVKSSRKVIKCLHPMFQNLLIHTSLYALIAMVCNGSRSIIIKFRSDLFSFHTFLQTFSILFN